MGKDALRLTTVLAATPQVIYRAWLDSTQHSAFSKTIAKMDGNIGGRFNLRDGKITGRNMALEFGRRILQSWRSAEFPKGATDSRLEILFESVGAGTRMTVMHSDLPEGMGEPLRSFWTDEYFGPMTDYFGKFVTLLANIPPSQTVIVLEDEPEEVEEAPKLKKAKGTIPLAPFPKEKLVGVEPPPSKKATLYLPRDEKKTSDVETSKAAPEKARQSVEKATSPKASKAEKPKTLKTPSAPPEKPKKTATSKKSTSKTLLREGPRASKKAAPPKTPKKAAKAKDKSARTPKKAAPKKAVRAKGPGSPSKTKSKPKSKPKAASTSKSKKPKPAKAPKKAKKAKKANTLSREPSSVDGPFHR